MKDSALIEELLLCSRKEEIPKPASRYPFDHAIFPWIKVARTHLLYMIGTLPKFFHERVLQTLEIELVQRLSKLCAPVFATQMHLAKHAGKLQGKTSKERYHDFVDSLYSRGELRRVFEEFPGLPLRIEMAVELWIQKCDELFKRVSADYQELQRRFGQGRDLKKLINIQGGYSDLHCGNRSVYELEFESEISIFYKPKPLGIDAAFTGLIEALNTEGLNPALKGYQVWDRGAYGWTEKITHCSCETYEEARLFYQRAGSLLCLFYLLGGTDLHYENLIANGPFPVVIDLESLFHPDSVHKELEGTPKPWLHSVSRVGMLPNYMFGAMGLKGVDISALGAKEGKKFPTYISEWEKTETDEMRLVYVQPQSKSEKNEVRVGKRRVNLAEFSEDVIEGFGRTYDFIEQKRDLFLKEKGWLETLSKHPVRYICRPTRLYYKLLHALLTPSKLYNCSKELEILNLLSKYLLENGMGHLAPIVEKEFQALKQDDIPFFQIQPDQNHLYLEGNILIKNILKTPSVEISRKLIASMSSKNRDDQIDFIRQSFHMVEFGKDNKSVRQPPNRVDHIRSDQQLLDESVRIGKELLKKARDDARGGLHWLGVEYFPQEESARLSSLEPNLYGGQLGVALFLAALFHATRQESWKRAAQAAMIPFLNRLKSEGTERLPGIYGIGGMTGIGSMVYCLNHIGELIKDQGLREHSLYVAKLVKQAHIAKDKRFDLISGSAGFILTLLSQCKNYPNPLFLELAHCAGDHLKAQAQVAANGVSWPTHGNVGMLGFSHGNAGIAFALEKLAEVTDDSSYKDIAKQALEYERSHFSNTHQNWPHFHQGKTTYDATAWCHGAGGIGLGRVCSSNWEDDPQKKEEIKRAIKTIKSSFRWNAQHLCCGDLGRADFLYIAAKKLDDDELLRFSMTKINQIIDQAKRNKKYICSNVLPAESYSPGFMQGVSGVGYTLLRYTKAGQDLPNVLILE